MKSLRLNLLLFCALATASAYSQVRGHLNPAPSTICNPMNLSYRFCLDDPSRREAADPTMILFRDEYYLFASKSGGYFHSTDLINWDLITTESLPIEDYAPTVMEFKGELYFMASTNTPPLTIYKTSDPKSGKWSVVNDKFPIGMTDPDLFADEDGRVFFYFGCSDQRPIEGVELDPKTFNPIGKPVALLNSDKKNHGWERTGDYNEKENNPWIEGSWMTKQNGTYYLQYSGPGTEFKSYCDGLYTSKSPLGPYKLAKHNPVSLKNGGFVTGAGHSSTFQDKYGNYWHISTMTISQKHMFERRLGLFPTFFDRDGEMTVYTGFGDFPFKVPTKKISSPEELFPKWMLLSYAKPVQASSILENHPLNFACDEEIRTFWSAKTGDKGEWFSIDLLKECSINALQVNFAENGTKIHGRSADIFYQYLIEGSNDGKTWTVLVDKTDNKTDVPHDYIELNSGVKARYIKITNHKVPDGTFAIADFRVFGTAGGKFPAKVDKINVDRSTTDRCVANLNWAKIDGAVGYNIRFGTSKDKLYHNYQVMGANTLKIGSLNSSQKYYFTVDAFNENGITKGQTIVGAE